MLIKQIKLYNPAKEIYETVSIRIRGTVVEDILPKNAASYHSESVFAFPGYYLYPGFIDSHCHFLGFGHSLLEKNIFLSQDPENWKKHLMNNRREYLLYRGWDEEKLGFLPDLALLDSLCPDKPVLWIRKCGHVGVINSCLLRSFPLDSFDHHDGTVLAHGYVTEKALCYLRNKIQSDATQLEESRLAASQFCLQYGLSSVHSEDCSVETLAQVIKTLNQENHIHIHEKIMITSPEDMEKTVVKIKSFPNHDFYSFGSFKIYLDGSLGGHNASLSSPYEDRPSEKGHVYYSVDALSAIIRKANTLKKQLAIHVIGDQALEICLQAFEYVTAHDEVVQNHRLVHVQLASNSQLSRIKRLPLTLNIQPIFFQSDQSMAMTRLGRERFEKIGYPFRDMAEREIPFSISSDAPVETMNPFVNLSHAESFMPRKKAYFAMTVAGAKQSSFPRCKGILEKGAYADGFFLPFDLFSVTQEELLKSFPPILLNNGKLFHQTERLRNETI